MDSIFMFMQYNDFEEVIGSKLLSDNLKEPMNNTVTNTSLTVLATALIALGVQSISTALSTGVIEIVLGIVLYAVYEYLPAK